MRIVGDMCDVPTVGLVFACTFHTFSILTLVAFTVERMIVVFRPFSNHVNTWPRLKVTLVILAMLLFSIFLNIPQMRQIPKILYRPETGTWVGVWDYAWIYCFCPTAVATIIMLPCNIALVSKLNNEGYFKKFGKRIIDGRKLQTGCLPRLPTLKLADFRITLVSIGISLFFIIATLPIAIFVFLLSFSEFFPDFPFDDQSELIYVVCVNICCVYCSFNSIFYSFISPDCRKELKMIVSKYFNFSK